MGRTLWKRTCTALAVALLTVTGGYAHSVPATLSDTMEQDIDVAVQGVDSFWKKHWSEYFTETYSSPRIVGLYDGTSTDAPTCGGQKLDAGNAYYCRPPEDYLAWDTNLMTKGYQTGDVYVYFIVAHEWGHAVQSRLDVRLQDVSKELQADCLAGAELKGAEQDGTIIFETGDVKELAQAITSLSDELPWTKVGDHGTANQRIHAFNKGLSEGVGGCLPLTAPR